MNVKIRPLDRLNDEALQLLVRELGHAKTARFLQHFSTGSGNYTEDRKDYFKNRTLEDLVRDIKAGQPQRSG